MSEFLLFAIPFSLVSFVPNFFFGSLLMLFGIEITLDWLIFSFRKVNPVYVHHARQERLRQSSLSLPQPAIWRCTCLPD